MPNLTDGEANKLTWLARLCTVAGLAGYCPPVVSGWLWAWTYSPEPACSPLALLVHSTHTDLNPHAQNLIRHTNPILLPNLLMCMLFNEGKAIPGSICITLHSVQISCVEQNTATPTCFTASVLCSYEVNLCTAYQGSKCHQRPGCCVSKWASVFLHPTWDPWPCQRSG